MIVLFSASDVLVRYLSALLYSSSLIHTDLILRNSILAIRIIASCPVMRFLSSSYLISNPLSPFIAAQLLSTIADLILVLHRLVNRPLFSFLLIHWWWV